MGPYSGVTAQEEYDKPIKETIHLPYEKCKLETRRSRIQCLASKENNKPDVIYYCIDYYN